MKGQACCACSLPHSNIPAKPTSSAAHALPFCRYLSLDPHGHIEDGTGYMSVYLHLRQNDIDAEDFLVSVSLTLALRNWKDEAETIKLGAGETPARRCCQPPRCQLLWHVTGLGGVAVSLNIASSGCLSGATCFLSCFCFVSRAGGWQSGWMYPPSLDNVTPWPASWCGLGCTGPLSHRPSAFGSERCV